ncbi:unnamed protein product [Rotaria sp. Silwood1]|nr:unnamed protein product [Rotaria sp. Silwood1]CAF4590432.1 unnamed protein product [Rotaria sp. Silwood1]
MGGSCSTCCASVVLPTNLSFNEIPVSTTVSINPKSTRIIENCIIIWLFDDPSNKFENEKKQLSRLIYGFQIFTNPDTCINYIRDIQDEKVFLIISVTYQSVQYIHDLPQLEKVYIFDSFSCDDRNCTLSNNTFHDINNLCKQLQYDIELCELDLIYFSVISNSMHDMKSSMTLTKEQASFVFIQLTNEIIARLKFESVAKDVFIDFSRKHYTNNPEQLHLIEEFAKYYRPNLALGWLKRSCFISKILNRVERTREIDILYKLGFFIKHLNVQLVRLYEENELLMKNISIVYRGKTMLTEEFDALIKNSYDGLLSFSNFLVTTINKENAIDFIHRRLTTRQNMIGIVFEIHIDHMIFNEEAPFALLTGNSTKNYEICFSAGTVFRIESIKQFTESSLIIWFVTLVLIRHDDPQLEHILKPFRTSELHENPLSHLGKLLMDMGEYRRAEQCFLEMINDTSILSQPRRLVRVHNGLGANYLHKGDYASALEHYKQALQVSLTYLSPDHDELAPMYKTIADCYLNQNDYSQALQNYERAINLIENGLNSPKAHMITELRTLVTHERVNLDDLSALLSERTRIIAIPYVSNLIGEILDIESIVKLVRQKCPCARVIVDGVAYASHRAIDVYSSHIAVLYGSNVAWQELVDISAISNHFFIPQSDISYQYELGCLNHEACARILGVKSYFE